jgi:hypothetical protein
MPDDEKLKIALEALKELRDHRFGSEGDGVQMHDIAKKAVLEIQLHHFAVERSWVVAEVAPGVQV